MIIRKNTSNGLKGKRTEQREQAGRRGMSRLYSLPSRDDMIRQRQKPSITMLFPFQDESCFCRLHPGRCPGLHTRCPLRGAQEGEGVLSL